MSVEATALQRRGYVDEEVFYERCIKKKQNFLKSECSKNLEQIPASKIVKFENC